MQNYFDICFRMKHIDLYFNLTLTTNVLRMKQVDLFIALTLSKTCGGKGGPYGEYYGGVITHLLFHCKFNFYHFSVQNIIILPVEGGRRVGTVAEGVALCRIAVGKQQVPVVGICL